MKKWVLETRKIQDFIETKLKEKLLNDQRFLKIFSEGDLQSCVYYHIRKFLDRNYFLEWYLTNKLPMGKITDSKTFPDIAIVHLSESGKKVRPAFLIELKEDYKKYKIRRVKSDIKKMEKLVKKYGSDLEQAYFIYAVVDKNHSSDEIDDEIYKTYSNFLKDSGYVIPITINIAKEKLLGFHEKDNFQTKYEKLRKYRK